MKSRKEIFTEAHKRTRAQAFKPAGYRKTFTSYLREVYKESKNVSAYAGYVEMDNTVVVLRETEKAYLIGCEKNSFEMWTPKSQVVIDNAIFVKDWLINKNRTARHFAA